MQEVTEHDPGNGRTGFDLLICARAQRGRDDRTHAKQEGPPPGGRSNLVLLLGSGADRRIAPARARQRTPAGVGWLCGGRQGDGVSATTSIGRGWCRLTGLTPITLWIACLLAVRNQRILHACDARQQHDTRRAAAGIPPTTRKRRRKMLAASPP